MKKFITLILSLGMVFSLAACNEAPEKPKEAPKTIKYEDTTSSATVGKAYCSTKEDYQSMVQLQKDIDKDNIITIDEYKGDVAITILAKEDLTDITYSEIDSTKFVDECNGDILTYVEKVGISNKGNLAKSIKKDQKVLLSAAESEGIPASFISYVDSKGDTLVYLISFNGKGE